MADCHEERGPRINDPLGHQFRDRFSMVDDGGWPTVEVLDERRGGIDP